MFKKNDQLRVLRPLMPQKSNHEARHKAQTIRIELPKRLQYEEMKRREASLDVRLATAVAAKNLCTILEPLRGTIQPPRSACDTTTIENLVLIYAVAQMLKLSADQWYQFCLSEHWHDHRRRPRTYDEDGSQALTFVLRFVVADSKASALTKGLNTLLSAFWEGGVSAYQLQSLIKNKLEKKATPKPLIWKVPNRPAAAELAAMTPRTLVTVNAVVHKDAKGRTVFDIQEVTQHEVLEPPLL